MANMTKTMAEIYKENKDEDGFLYVTYASQEMFGSPQHQQDRGYRAHIQTESECI